MRKFLLPGSVLLFLLALMTAPEQGCYYDSEERLYGVDTTACDTANMHYSVEITQLISDNCLRCHSGTFPSGDLDLSTYQQLKTVADNGKLVTRINDASAPMPQDVGLMPLCNRQKIEAWVNAGAPNN